MGVIVDTCVWVDIERGRLRPVEVAEVIQNDIVFLTPTILAELQRDWIIMAGPPNTGSMTSGLRQLPFSMATRF